MHVHAQVVGLNATTAGEMQRRWRDGSLEEDLPMRGLSEVWRQGAARRAWLECIACAIRSQKVGTLARAGHALFHPHTSHGPRPCPLAHLHVPPAPASTMSPAPFPCPLQLFNVNYFVCSQTNPYVLPLIGGVVEWNGVGRLPARPAGLGWAWEAAVDQNA